MNNDFSRPNQGKWRPNQSAALRNFPTTIPPKDTEEISEMGVGVENFYDEGFEESEQEIEMPLQKLPTKNVKETRVLQPTTKSTTSSKVSEMKALESTKSTTKSLLEEDDDFIETDNNLKDEVDNETEEIQQLKEEEMDEEEKMALKERLKASLTMGIGRITDSLSQGGNKKNFLVEKDKN